MEVSGQLHAPTALSPVKQPPVPIGKEAGRSPEPVCAPWRTQKSLALAENRILIPPSSIPQSSDYTNRAIPTPSMVVTSQNLTLQSSYNTRYANYGTSHVAQRIHPTINFDLGHKFGSLLTDSTIH
jgi:hypothetical protein